jgi:hypothetical protein
MSKTNLRHPEKIQQHFSLNLNIAKENSEQFRIVSIRLDINELKFIKNIGIEDLNPYFVITAGKEIRRTGNAKEINNNIYKYREVYFIFEKSKRNRQSNLRKCELIKSTFPSITKNRCS